SEPLVAPHLFEERGQELVPYGEVDEPGRRERDVGERVAGLEPGDHVVGDCLRRPPMLLRRGQHAATLELSQIRTLRRDDLAKRRVVARGREDRRHLLGQHVSERDHLRWILAGAGGTASGSLASLPMTRRAKIRRDLTFVGLEASAHTLRVRNGRRSTVPGVIVPQCRRSSRSRAAAKPRPAPNANAERTLIITRRPSPFPSLATRIPMTL